ncbi:MAG: hypothetical protein AAGD47_05410 [Pseudomonadota bacterium]
MTAASDLDNLDISLSIDSSEGLDVNHASRARLQFLAAQSHALLAQTQFADAKAAALMAISGLLAIQGPAGTAHLSAGEPLLLLSFLCTAACLVGCFLTIVPRFPRPAIRRRIYLGDRFSWPGLVDTTHDEDAFPDFMRTAEASHLVLSLARSNQATARVLHRKFAILRITFWIGMAALAFIAINAFVDLLNIPL